MVAESCTFVGYSRYLFAPTTWRKILGSPGVRTQHIKALSLCRKIEGKRLLTEQLSRNNRSDRSNGNAVNTRRREKKIGLSAPPSAFVSRRVDTCDRLTVRMWQDGKDNLALRTVLGTVKRAKSHSNVCCIYQITIKVW